MPEATHSSGHASAQAASRSHDDSAFDALLARIDALEARVAALEAGREERD
jgi:hypothetical protein